MCRLLAYIGSPTSLERLLYEPEHSLIVQSYQPQEMLSGVVNADGFGVGWYRQDGEAFSYRNILPIWNDLNLPSLSRYIESENILAYVRSATSGQPLDLSNSQPFRYKNLLFIHNGRVEKFRQSLYRSIRNLLSDEIYTWIKGSTDSEHIFGLFLERLQNHPTKGWEQVLQLVLNEIHDLAETHQTDISANLVISDSKRLLVSRYATKSPAPSLYWLKNHPSFPNSVIIASEPLFAGDWIECPENSIIIVGQDGDIYSEQI
ncbi:ergothioneine biosynthesis protein EgtC [Calothrix sp. PCC 6303]|uniref:ergothioneine biosynthesis protein EgtC n=1 Tax=Calothrix sp. PCC 6303 TaxID=1170562 RepID=UPI0002EE16C2|nr:ergothioneine biosynthesis protein EgtC [Calothrix sp. PCC 6303]